MALSNSRSKMYWKTKDFRPAVIGTNETALIFPVAAGWRVIDARVRVVEAWTAASTPTISLGDGTDVDGYVTDADIDEESVAEYPGNGAFLNLARQGKLYSVDDSIDLTYVAGVTPGTTGKVRVSCLFARGEVADAR